MPENPKVSVILTSYNHAKHLREAIDSALAQTFSDFELIIWDDASTDESWQIISSYTDPRIRTFSNESNLRGGNVRRAIEQAAQGRYIAVHHSDDVWELQKLEKQVAFLDSHPEIGAVFSWAQIVDENGLPLTDEMHPYYKIFEQPNRTRFEWLNYFFHRSNALCHPSVLIRKQCYDDVGLYRYGFAQLTDFDMWVRLCRKYEIHVLPEKLVRFRVWANEVNISGDRPDARIRMQFELFQIYDNYREIKTPEEFVKVFPTAKKYFKPGGFEIDFALGMIALGVETFNTTKLFGLSLLFETLNDPNKAKKINELYGFRHVNFVDLTAEHDVFSIETVRDLNETVRDLQMQKSALSSHLQIITQSRAWKLASFLQKAWSGVRAFVSR